jgi:conjugal transfer ATP-binding protein TraC
MMIQSKSLSRFKEFEVEFPLASELPYWDFLDGDDSCIVLADGTLVKGLRLTGYPTETIDDDQWDQLTLRLRASLNSLPDGTDVQFMVDVNSNFSQKISSHEQLKRSHALVKWLHEARVAKLKNEVTQQYLRKANLYLFIYLRVETVSGGLKSFFTKPKAFEKVRSEIHNKRAYELNQLTNGITANFESIGITSNPLSNNEIRDLIYKLLNPTRSQSVGCPTSSAEHRGQEFSPEELSKIPELTLPSPREQLVFSDLIQHADGFFLDGYYHRIITLKTLPEFTQNRLISELMSLPFHFTLSLQVKVPEQSKELSSLQAKRRMAHSMAVTRGGRASDLESEAKLQSTEDVLRELINTGQKIFYFQLAVLIKSKTKEELELQIKSILSAFRKMSGAEGLTETVAGLKVFKTIMPAGNTTMVRGKRIKTDNLTDFLPVYQPWEGDPRPVCLFHNRSNGLISYDPFDSRLPNFNSLITGSSGSGKSFLNACVLLQFLSQNPQIFIVEVGNSKGKICEFMGGTRIEMGAMKNGVYQNAINPFLLSNGETQPPPRKIKFLISLLETIFADEEGEKLSKLNKSLLEEAIIATYSRLLPKMPRLSDLVVTLENNTSHSVLKDFAKMLYPWTGNRPYGRLLDSENALNLEKDLVVFDLKGLDEDLRGPMILIITDFILSRIGQNPSRKGQIYLDEVWDLLKSRGAVQFMEFSVRTLRKEGWGISFITQGIDEIVSSSIGSAILNNTATKFILFQKGDVEPIRKTLKLNDKEMTLILNLKQAKGHFSEVFFIANENRCVARIMPTPLEYWLATSDPPDNEMLLKAREKFPDKTFSEIIHFLATHYPLGSQGKTLDAGVAA